MVAPTVKKGYFVKKGTREPTQGLPYDHHFSNNSQFIEIYQKQQARYSMEPKNDVVSKIEGEYAYLKDLDNPSAEELFIAMAL